MKVGLFPGQGIPARTVLAALPAGDALVSTASEILCYDLRNRVAAVAKRQRSVLPTSLAQPAIFTASLVSWFEGGARCDALVGHSLGEYAALVAGEAMSFEHGLCAVQVRGAAMNSIASRSTGGMVALLDLSIDQCEEIATDAGVSIANDNCPGQMVVAGDDDALARAAELAKTRGGRAVRLEVTGPFHTSAMGRATGALRDVLDHIAIRSPKVPVVSNVSARPYRAPGEIRKLLVEQ
ncbi:MAG: ACP S-malonyltransferase, partial [Actinomycetota bacterium]